METRGNFINYIALVAFILLHGYSNARPMMDSYYDDYVISGKIIPISGAVPHKIHSHERNRHHQKTSTSPSTTAKEMKAQSNARPMMDSYSGDSVHSGEIIPISGAVPHKIHSHEQNGRHQKVKKILDMLGIDLSQIDVMHKFDGKDSLQPSLCHDTYDDRYGVGKHFVRGARDVGFAIVSGAEDLIDELLADLPLVPRITNGIGGGLKAVLCAIEDGFSDIASDLDSAIDIAKNGLVDFFKLKGPHPVLGIPIGIGDIAREGVEAAGQLVGDTVDGVKNAVGEILNAL